MFIFFELCFSYLNLNPNLADEKGNTALHFVETVEVAKILRLAGADLFRQNVNEVTPTHTAARRNLGRLASFFLSFAEDQKVEINRTDNEGNSPLIYAVTHFLKLIQDEMIQGREKNSILNVLDIFFSGFLYRSFTF